MIYIKQFEGSKQLFIAYVKANCIWYKLLKVNCS